MQPEEAGHTGGYVCDVTESDVERFLKAFPIDGITNLGSFHDSRALGKAMLAARNSFAEKIEVAEELLNNPDVALAVLRFPPPLRGTTRRSDALLTAILSIAIGGCLTEPRMDPVNGTPFTLTKTSSRE